MDNRPQGRSYRRGESPEGSLLSIKPIVEIRDGVAVEESKQRTRAFLDYLVNKLKNAGPLAGLAVAHAAAPDLEAFPRQAGRHLSPDQILVNTSGGHRHPCPGQDASESATDWPRRRAANVSDMFL